MRQEYLAEIKGIDPRRIYYFDESGFDLKMQKEYGWGIKVVASKPTKMVNEAQEFRF